MKTVYITRNDLFKNISMVLCNNITNVDESFMEDNPELYEIECDVCKGVGEIAEGDKMVACEECTGEGRHDLEMYQSFIIGADEWEIERMKSFGVQIGYSNALEVFVLGVYDFGTGWSAFSYSKEVPDDYELAFDETFTRQTPY